jgi:hypothetical protein
MTRSQGNKLMELLVILSGKDYTTTFTSLPGTTITLRTGLPSI